MNSTLDYYTRQADAFFQDTAHVSFSEAQNRFLALLPQHASILDLGCGSGRDALAFMQQGLQVEAADGCPAMAQKASQLLGKPVQVMLFEELEAEDRYDGIWACASLLHVPSASLPKILEKIEAALRPGGILYCSFKYGDFEGLRNGRYFTDLDEARLVSLIEKTASLQKTELWLSQDVRPGRHSERWINLLARKEPGKPDSSCPSPAES